MTQLPDFHSADLWRRAGLGSSQTYRIVEFKLALTSDFDIPHRMAGAMSLQPRNFGGLGRLGHSHTLPTKVAPALCRTTHT